MNSGPGRALAVLERHGVVPRIDDAQAFAQGNQVLLLRHADSGTPVDLSLAWRERDHTDIERLLLLHGSHMDLQRVRRWVRDFADLLETPERIEVFEGMVRRAAGETDARLSGSGSRWPSVLEGLAGAPRPSIPARA